MSDEAKPEWPAIYEKCDACGATIHCQHEDALSKAEAQVATLGASEQALRTQLMVAQRSLAKEETRADAAEARVKELEAKLKRFEGYVRCFTADGWAEHQQAAESRATQLARQVEMFRRLLDISHGMRDGGHEDVGTGSCRCPDCSAIDASLAAPQGAPKKEGA